MRPTLLFDLDDTLLDFGLGERLSLISALKQMGYPADEAVAARYSEINLSQWKRLERGEITRAEVLVNRFKILFDELGVDFSPNEAWAVYEGFISKQGQLIDGARELLEGLQRDYDLCIVSNGTASVQDSRIKIADISKYFKHIFISQRIGVNKPSPLFFEGCFEQMPQVRKADCLIIGDSLTSDIKGGLLSGIKTCWYNPRGLPPDRDIPADYEIASLSELMKLLKQIFS